MRSNEYVNCDHIIELDLNFIAMKNQFSSIRRDNNKKKKTISLSFLALDARLKMPNVVSSRVVSCCGLEKKLLTTQRPF